MTCVVISQPMFLPWVGMLEQIRLCDVYVHYDDVAFSKGSFVNRVQVKTVTGISWLTLPVRAELGQPIRDVQLSERTFARKHLLTLRQAYAKAPYLDAMMAVAEATYAVDSPWLLDWTVAGLDALLSAFALRPPRVVFSSELGIPGANSNRVLDIVMHLSGTTYVTGRGALDYLDHQKFEQAGVDVRYVRYATHPWPQLHGPFTPFVTALDLLANVGPAGRSCIVSETIPWKELAA
ncbi:MAG: WbqC family protein [Myxococcales bacterium]|nr:WbqC family protein [Myxococcales bacterium]